MNTMGVERWRGGEWTRSRGGGVGRSMRRRRTESTGKYLAHARVDADNQGSRSELGEGVFVLLGGRFLTPV